MEVPSASDSRRSRPNLLRFATETHQPNHPEPLTIPRNVNCSAVPAQDVEKTVIERKWQRGSACCSAQQALIFT
jgi:hypothetical protein